VNTAMIWFCFSAIWCGNGTFIAWKPLKKWTSAQWTSHFYSRSVFKTLCIYNLCSRVRKGSPAPRPQDRDLALFFQISQGQGADSGRRPHYELETPKLVRRLPRYLSLEESQSLLNTASDSDAINQVRDTCISRCFSTAACVCPNSAGSRGRHPGDTLTVLGKGAKERTSISIPPAWKRWMMNKVRPPDKKLKDPEALFTTRLGTRIKQQNGTGCCQALPPAGRTGSRPLLHPQASSYRSHLDVQLREVDIRVLQRILDTKAFRRPKFIPMWTTNSYTPRCQQPAQRKASPLRFDISPAVGWHCRCERRGDR
jgi:hypothetical protein